MPRLVPEDAGRDDLEPEELFLAVAAYVPVLCLLPTLSRSDSDFARTHGRQGIVLFLAEIASGMAAFLPFIGLPLAGVLLICLAAGAIRGIPEVLHGRIWHMPVVGAVAERLRMLAS